MMSCSIEPDPRVLEAKLDNGLIRGHAYSITKVIKVQIDTGRKSGLFPLVRIRNPWGNEANGMELGLMVQMNGYLYPKRKKSSMESFVNMMENFSCLSRIFFNFSIPWKSATFLPLNFVKMRPLDGMKIILKEHGSRANLLV